MSDELIKILEKKDMPQWDEFVASHENGSIYHTAAWANLIEKVYGHRPFYAALVDKENNIRAGIPFILIKNGIFGSRLTSMPGAHSCNPLISGFDDYKRIINFCLAYRERHSISYLEMRLSEKFEYADRLEGDCVQDYSGNVLELSGDLRTIRGNLHRTCIRNKINKAEQCGFTIEKGSSLSDMREFYFFYLKSRKAKGLLPEPFKLFKYMWLCFNDLGNLEILKAMYQNRTIASSVIFKYADTVVIEYCFGDDAYRSFGVNQFLFWEIIKSAKMQDYNYVDFGRTSDKNVTLQQFKLRWNTKRKKLIYS